MSNDKDIAIVGMACVFPRAANVRQFWSNLANGVDAIDSPPPRRWSECSNVELAADHEAFLPTNRGGFLPTDLPFDPVRFGVLPNLVRHGDPDQFLMLHVIDEALQDARIALDSPLRKRTDVIIGRGGYSTGKMTELTLRAEVCHTVLELLERHSPDAIRPRRRDMEAFLRSTLTPRAADNVSTAIPNITASRTANRLNLRGAAYTVDAACASSLLAVEQAMWRLRTRQCDLAVASGVFLNLTQTFLYVFTQIGALSPSGVIRPFDRRADGLLAGEGGGAVVLKRLGDAIRDGDAIYAILKGAGSASDGREVDVLAPSCPGQVQALANAYADAGVERDTIGYLELHGTGTLIGDLTELATVKTFFGTVREPATARAMGSVKSMIGHCMPAAGIAALIKTALALSNKILPPSLHCEEPRPELADAPFYLITQTRPWIHNPAHGPRRAGVNAFGFGGINAHLVLEEVPAVGSKRSVTVASSMGEQVAPDMRSRPIEPGLHRASELVVFSADSEPALREQALRLERFLDQDKSCPALADVACSLSQTIDAKHRVKLAMICEDIAHLRKLLRRWLDHPESAAVSEEVAEIYFSADVAAHRGKIAFIFPGMGFPGLIGNYPDHLLELCMHYPEGRAEFDYFEDRDRHPDDNVPTSAIFSPPLTLPEEHRQRLKSRLAPPKVDDSLREELPPGERYLAAMGVTLSNWVSWILLRKFAIPVDMVTGQSQGEMAALCAVGIADFHDIAPGFWKVLNLDSRAAAGQQLAFAWATEETVAPLLAEEPNVHLAIHMSPQGLVLGGDRDGLLRIAAKLQQEQILIQLLPYPPIHTPCLSHLRGELLEQLGKDKAEPRKPRIPFYSSITTELYPDDAEGIRDTLMMNVDRPLRIWQTIRRMYADGARLFVQVGGGHMAAHLKAMLPEGSEVVTCALDVDTRNPLTQMNHLCATLFCAGVPLTLAPLFEYRGVRALDFDRPQPEPKPSRTALPLRIDWSPLKHENAQRRAAPIPPEPVLEIPAEAQRMPVLGRVTRFVPGSELTVERTLTLAEDLYLQDHLFIYAESKPLHERLPILPLTMSLEFVAEAASLLSPGLGLIGFENVRGQRWIGLLDCEQADIRIECRVESLDEASGVQRVHGTIFIAEQASFSATVLFAESYRQDLEGGIADSSADGPWPFGVEDLRSERYLFHGPRFWTVNDLHTLGNPGASGSLLAMPRDDLFASRRDPLLLTDPCLMDGVGQVVGLWMRVHGEFILPIGVEKIEFYAPPPPPGTTCRLRMEVVSCEVEVRQVRFNIELDNEAGEVWARFQGWTDWLLNWPTRYDKAARLPQRHVLSEEIDLPGLPEGAVCMLATRECFTGIDLEWAARWLLHSSEMPSFWEASSKDQRRQLVASRAAAKDAARVWWARKYGTPMPHPAELCIAHDALGAPYLEPGDDPLLPHISIAHTKGGAVAIAADAPIGVDLEEAERDTRGILPEFATADECIRITQLAEAHPHEAFETRLWCAKEAAAKALGTGLQGRPKDLEAVECDDEGAFLIQHAPTGERLVVCSARVDRFLVACTARPVEAPV
ncbi:MAG TPA: beta-ketoacyl synthase N-terminal-like domain-containing protein [Gemmataceae bacterium]|jgi:acyl transferase domain-containing protein/phosphopantetheinyl transferase